MDGPGVKALAYRLEHLLAGRPVERLDVRADRWQANVLLKHCAGQTVQRVYAHGRWLLWDFSHGLSWICHPLRGWRWAVEMTSSVPILNQAASGDSGSVLRPLVLRPGRRPLLRFTLAAGMRVVLSGRPLLVILPTAQVWQHPYLAGLGPDVLDAGFSPQTWAAGLHYPPRYTVAQVLLDEQLIAGIGNPTKCEILLAMRLHPATPAAMLSRAQWERIVAAARERLVAACHAALQSGAAEAAPYRVYDRAGEPCDRCGAAIRADRSGADGRWSWYCPACQARRMERTLFSPESGA